jgi:hypothetical protein
MNELQIELWAVLAFVLDPFQYRCLGITPTKDRLLPSFASNLQPESRSGVVACFTQPEVLQARPYLSIPIRRGLVPSWACLNQLHEK